MLQHFLLLIHRLKLIPQNNFLFRKLFLLTILLSNLYSDAHVFVYHRFGDNKHASTNTSLEVLTKQFEFFKKNHYKVVSLSLLHTYLLEKKDIPDNWVILTIDDSYKSFYTNALTLFKKYHYPFTLFVYVQATQEHYGDFMSWKQIKKSANYGEIALHSYAHKHLVSIGVNKTKNDTQKAYDIFTKNMGFTPKYYAYPYGEYTPLIKETLKKFNFNLIFNQNSGAIDKESDRFDLDRIALTGEVNLKSKLRIKTLHVTWLKPTKYPKNGKLNIIHAKIPPNLKSVEYYVSGNAWKKVSVSNTELIIHPNITLKYKRTRIFIKYQNRQNSIILVKE